MNKGEAYSLLNALRNKENSGAIKISSIFIWLSILYWTGRYENALKFLSKNKNKLGRVELNCWKGTLYYYLKDYTKATTYFEEAESIEYDIIEIKYFLAETLYRRAEIEKAKSKYRMLTGDVHLKNMGYYGIGCCLHKLKRYDEAIGFLNQALIHSKGKNIVDIMNKKGLCLMAQERLDDAKECFYSCMQKSPDDSFVKINLALVLSKLGQYKEAKELYIAVLQKMPHNLTAINNLSLCLATLEEYEEALTYCNKGLEIDPLNTDLLINKGYCLYKLEYFKNALECLNEAQKIASDDIVLLNNKALCLMALENYDEALGVLNLLMEREGSDDTLINKAFCLIKKDMHKEALNCLAKVKNKDDNRFDIYTLKGICFEKLGELGKAVDSFNESLIIVG